MQFTVLLSSNVGSRQQTIYAEIEFYMRGWNWKIYTSTKFNILSYCLLLMIQVSSLPEDENFSNSYKVASYFTYSLGYYNRQ